MGTCLGEQAGHITLWQPPKRRQQGCQLLTRGAGVLAGRPQIHCARHQHCQVTSRGAAGAAGALAGPGATQVAARRGKGGAGVGAGWRAHAVLL